MKLSVPINWDIELLEALKDYPVDDVYGAMDRTIIGGGRPTWSLPTVNKKQVEKYIEKTHSLGMKFTYLLNASCLNNIEYSKKSHLKIIKFLKWINDIKVDYVTVTIPYLIEIIKNDFPNLKVKVSTIAHINSVQKAKFFEALGVDEITTDFMINRDFHLLKKIKETTKCNIEVVLNDICLYQCPFRAYHYNVVGHASQTLNSLKGFYLDYCLIRCSIIRFTGLKEILKSRWIRPEDIHYYEDIGIGSFKISGRTRSMEWILNVIKAYTSRKYNGNLLDLIDCIESPNYKIEHSLNIKRYKNLLNYILVSPFKSYKDSYDWYSTSRKMSNYIYIDNNKLNGFINFFKNKDCPSSCEECDYCERWAKDVIKIDQNEVNKYINILSILSNKVISK